MIKINIPFSVPLGYQSPLVTLNKNVHTLSFTLHDGTNIAVSDRIDLGVVHGLEGRRLLGQLTFKYDYDSEKRVVTVCGTTFDSADSMCLTTVPEGTSEYCRQRAGGGGFAGDDLSANPHWNYRTSLTPGFQDVLRGVIRTVNDRLIGALEKEPRLIVQVRKHPPELSAEEHQQFLTVYRDGKFHSFYEPGQQLGPRDMLVTVDSVWGGEVTLQYGEAFANVIGSTNDPKIGGSSWIKLWETQFNTTAVICTSNQFNGFACGSTFVGGHVIAGTQAKTVAMGSNSVWIFPICVAHNKNDNVYMEALMYLEGIWLKNYLGT
jgi:hypothetical protein